MRTLAAWLGDTVDLLASRSIDVSACESVALTLGPYRNLTTLTASLLFLHPHCQVLNHAGDRIFGRRELDFLSEYSRERLDRFIQYAIRISAKGKRGVHGGSITHSHAFDDQHAMKEVFEGSGGALVKPVVRCLFWKESLRTSNRIREKRVDLGAIFEQDPRPRFLLPIRNPLDCAVSNIQTGHTTTFEGLPADADTERVALAVLDEIRWVAGLQERHPDRFFHFFEYGMTRAMLVKLAAFLGLEPLDSWLDAALAAIRLKKGYEHEPALIDAYRRGIEERFEGHPELAAGLLYFVEG
jgi:hypothetical protein